MIRDSADTSADTEVCWYGSVCVLLHRFVRVVKYATVEHITVEHTTVERAAVPVLKQTTAHGVASLAVFWECF